MRSPVARLRGVASAIAFVFLFGAHVGDAASAEDGSGDKYALIISAGKSKFRESLVETAVKSLKANGFEPARTTLLTAEKATWEHIATAVDTLYEQLSDRDMLVVYVAGSGTLLGEGDAKESVLFLWNNTAIRTSRLAEHLAALDTMSGVVVFDAPYSGEFIGEFRDTNFVTIAPAKENDAEACATFALVLWKELERGAKDKQQKFLNSVEGAYSVAEAHAKRRSPATPLIAAPYDAEHFFLWLPPRDQVEVDRRLGLGSSLVPPMTADLQARIAAAADEYDPLPESPEDDVYEDAPSVDVVE
ncbi:hypothetical protein FJZ36_16540 [Candidatus Poribacteria bacterium]|nr:hypothetical protein [Candidatus Poribacteria bacterium]